MNLSRFSEIFNANEFDDVEFTAKIINIRYIDDLDSSKSIITFFDGYSENRFIIYNDNNKVRELLFINTVYHFYGKARGTKRRYFMLTGYELVPITVSIENKYYPERFKKPSEQMFLIYNTSVASIADNDLREFVCFCLGLKGTKVSEKKRLLIYNKFAEAPASINHHDCYSGGYIAHISGMLANLENVKRLYTGNFRFENGSSVDWDLLYALVYLHDVGKPLTYRKNEFNHFMWNDNCLEDHATLGGQYVYSCWAQSKLISFSQVQKLCYCITEHMSTKYDTKVPELGILKALDNLDASVVSILMRK